MYAYVTCSCTFISCPSFRKREKGGRGPSQSPKRATRFVGQSGGRGGGGGAVLKLCHGRICTHCASPSRLDFTTSTTNTRPHTPPIVQSRAKLFRASERCKSKVKFKYLNNRKSILRTIKITNIYLARISTK